MIVNVFFLPPLIFALFKKIYFYFREASLVKIMGKGPKHNSKSRNNGIFKVAGQNFKQGNKGKPKEVTSKLKLV